jgi:hypothetical protein
VTGGWGGVCIPPAIEALQTYELSEFTPASAPAEAQEAELGLTLCV